MARRLAHDEAALWDLVTQSVRPLHQKPAAPGPASPSAPPAAPAPSMSTPARRDAGPRKAPVAPSPPGRPRAAPAETLDGSWDKRLASQRLLPDRTIDLHGLSADAARHLLYRQVSHAEAAGERILLVITGKGHMPGPAPADLMPGLAPVARPRGAIRVSLPRWLGEDGLSHRIAAVRRAHPRHGGAGAVYLVLKRRRP